MGVFSEMRNLDSPFIIVKLLNSLKRFYTFKDLESKIGIPSQVLWRYTSLHSIPERKTARKIIEKIEEHKLVERVIERVVTVNSYGYVESWRYMCDIHFLGLVGYEAAKFAYAGDIDVVLAFPEEDAPLALVVSEWLRSKACIGFTRLKISIEKYYQASYVSLDRREVVNVYIPRTLIGEDDSILIVKNVAKDWASLKALTQIACIAKARIWGLLVVVSLSDEWVKRAYRYGIKNIKILKNLAAQKSQDSSSSGSSSSSSISSFANFFSSSSFLVRFLFLSDVNIFLTALLFFATIIIDL